VQAKHRILTPEQCAKIIANLDECIDMFEQKPGVLNAIEIRTKTLLTVLRGEIVRGASEDGQSVFN
jgi:hypothetical protein